MSYMGENPFEIDADYPIEYLAMFSEMNNSDREIKRVIKNQHRHKTIMESYAVSPKDFIVRYVGGGGATIITLPSASSASSSSSVKFLYLINSSLAYTATINGTIGGIENPKLYPGQVMCIGANGTSWNYATIRNFNGTRLIRTTAQSIDTAAEPVKLLFPTLGYDYCDAAYKVGSEVDYSRLRIPDSNVHRARLIASCEWDFAYNQCQLFIRKNGSSEKWYSKEMATLSSDKITQQVETGIIEVVGTDYFEALVQTTDRVFYVMKAFFTLEVMD